MIVRELVTLLKYDVDSSGIDSYSSALKNLAGWIGGIFAVHKIMDMADEWATVAGRVQNVTNSVSETDRVMNKLQEQAEATGMAFEGIGSLFAQLKTTGSSLNYTTDQVLELTNAISQLTTLGGGTAAAGKRGMIQIEEMFSLGTVQMQHLKALIIDIPGAVDVIAGSMEGGKKKFMEMVHAGTMTSKMFGDLFLKAQGDIERRFKNMPLTFARAFETVHSFFGRLIYDIGKASNVWTTLANMIIGGGRAIVNTIRWMADTVGGFTNLLELMGIAFLAAIGPGVLAAIGRIVVAVRGMTLAGIVAASPWWLIAGAILAIGLAVQDLWTWMDGGKSITEDLIGPFENWRSTVVGAVDEISTRFMAWGDIAADLFDDLRTRVMVWSDAIGAAFDENADGFADLKAKFLDILPDNWDPLKFLREGITASREQIEQIRGLLAQLLPEMATGASSWTLGGEIRKTLNDLATMLASVKEVFRYLNMTPTEILGEIGKKVHLDSRGNVTFGQAPAPAVDPVTGAPMPAPDPARSPRDFPLPYSSDRLMPGNLVPPSALLPPGANSNVAPVVTSNTTVNITTANDNPAGIGAAAAAGAQRGTSDGLSRELRNVMPGAEFGLSR